MDEPVAVVTIGAAVCMAGLVQSLSGFGSGLVLVSVASWVMDITFVVPFAGIFSYLTVLTMVWRHRENVRLKRALPLIVGLAPGVPVGMAFLKGVDATLATGALGLVLIAYTAWSLWSARSAREVRVSPRWGPAFGLVAGVLGGAFNCSGPPVVMYSTLQDWRKGEVVGTLTAFFLVQGAFTLTLFTLDGLITPETLRWNLSMFPLLILGVWIGDRLHHKIDEVTFRKVVLVALMAMGLAFVLRLVATAL